MLRRMDWLNYHHLFYFWTVAREGSIARACDKLLLAQPTISGQLRALEKSLGDKLFTRAGRGLALTDTGRMVYRYADEIFSLGKELSDTLKGRPSGRPIRLMVGVADVLPKMISFRLLEPALRLPEAIQVVCREDKPDRLLADLAVHGLDIVLADAPVSPSVKVRAFNHLLGECGVSVMGTADLAKSLRKRFPQSLDGAPFLLPTDNTSLRRALDQWFDARAIRPAIRAEFEDSALLKVFGQAGVGVFVAPTAVEDEVRDQFGVQLVGRINEVRERFYAISVERKLKHPAVLAISDAARQKLFKDE
jgi:LysR family transcriptional regulator, transcriptional activator of nhaA